ncbi:unnamed protein product [Sympodiomycopsis kandeliae]
MTNATSIEVEEVQIFQSSLTADEFRWVGSPDDVESWQQLVTGTDSGALGSQPMSYSVRLQQLNPTLWLDVDYSRVAGKDASIHLKDTHDQVDPQQLANLKQVIKDQWEQSKVDGVTHRVFDLYTFLQEHLLDHPLDIKDKSPSSSASQSPRQQKQQIILSRTIIWSHHLIAPSKRKDFSNWSHELNLWILLKIGYPGYMIFEGSKTSVDEIVRRVKGLQWHAISTKFEESWQIDHQQGEEELLRQCGLAKCYTHDSGIDGGKVRTRCEEVESIKEIMERLRIAGMEESQIVEALGLRVKSGAQAK